MVCSAQIWSNLGAERHYGFVNYGPPVSQGYLKLNYVHDSLVGSIVYKKLVVTPFYASGDLNCKKKVDKYLIASVCIF